jgi:hypothetical protein
LQARNCCGIGVSERCEIRSHAVDLCWLSEPSAFGVK